MCMDHMLLRPCHPAQHRFRVLRGTLPGGPMQFSVLLLRLLQPLRELHPEVRSEVLLQHLQHWFDTQTVGHELTCGSLDVVDLFHLSTDLAGVLLTRCHSECTVLPLSLLYIFGIDRSPQFLKMAVSSTDCCRHTCL